MSAAPRSEWTSGGSSATWRALLVGSDIGQLLVAGMLLDFVLFSGTSVGALLRWLSIGVLLFAVARSHIWLLLLAIQASLLVREPSRPDASHGLDSFLYCFAALALVAYASSFRMTRRHIGHFVASNLYRMIADDSKVVPSESAHDPSSGVPQPVRSLLALRALLLMGVVVGSMLFFAQLPISRDVRLQWWERSVDNDLTLWPGPTVLILAIAFAILFWQSEWRQITASQARSVVRSALVSSHYADLKMIVARRMRASKKGAPRKPVAPSIDIPAANPVADK